MKSEIYEKHVVTKCPRCGYQVFVKEAKTKEKVWMCALCEINVGLGREGIDPWKESEENQPKRPRKERPKKTYKKVNLR